VWRHWATVFTCILVWITVVAVRTHTLHDYSPERWFAVGAAGIAAYVAGLTVQKIIHEKENRR
jgi:hypothetical protein